MRHYYLIINILLLPDGDLSSIVVSRVDVSAGVSVSGVDVSDAPYVTRAEVSSVDIPIDSPDSTDGAQERCILHAESVNQDRSTVSDGTSGNSFRTS